MWMWVSGVPVGIILSVLLLPTFSGPIPTVFMVLAALFWGVTVLSRRLGRAGLLQAGMTVFTASLIGLGIGSFVKARVSPWHLDAGSTYFLRGEVVGVPGINRFSTRYRLKASCLGHTATDCMYFDNLVPLIWPVVVEVSFSASTQTLKPGQQVQIQVQSKQSRVQSSPAAFNTKRWLLSNHIVARLKRKKGTAIALIDDAWFAMDRIRTDLNQYISQQGSTAEPAGISSYPVILALLSGDRSLMSDRHWELFNRTGTTHLVAISGLHVGLVATLVVFLALPLFRRWRWFTNRYPAGHGALVLAWLVSLGYCSLAGFAVPTQRALIMLSVFVILKLTGRAQHIWFGLMVALCAVLLWDPVACLSLGFWLSFIAVFLILWLIGGGVTVRSVLSQWSTVQIGLFVGLAPALLWAVHSVSLVSGLTNAVAIPLIGFVVVPLSLAWGALWSLLGDQVMFLLHWVVHITDGLLWLLNLISGWRYSIWSVGERSLATLLLAMIGVLWMALQHLECR